MRRDAFLHDLGAAADRAAGQHRVDIDVGKSKGVVAVLVVAGGFGGRARRGGRIAGPAPPEAGWRHFDALVFAVAHRSLAQFRRIGVGVDQREPFQHVVAGFLVRHMRLRKRLRHRIGQFAQRGSIEFGFGPGAQPDQAVQILVQQPGRVHIPGLRAQMRDAATQFVEPASIEGGEHRRSEGPGRGVDLREHDAVECPPYQ